MNFSKVLICAPTASAKNYCFDEWIKNVMDFTYPNFEVALFDNTKDKGKNSDYLNNRYKEIFGNNNKFKAYHSDTDNIKSVIERMCVSHNMCRDMALNKGYEYILHLETDIFPERDIIETLMYHNKKVVGALYDRDEGKWRKTMLQWRVYSSNYNVESINFEAGQELSILSGGLKEFSHIGLGCVLIKTKVFEKIKFRFVQGKDSHPDTYFAEDCFRNQIPIYADTSKYCKHDNTAWGIYGLDFI